MPGLRGQVGRYLLVGGIVWLVDVGTFAAFLWPFGLTGANIAGRVAGAIVGFGLHRRWTFAGQHRDGAVRQAVAYLALLQVNIIGSTLLLRLLVGSLQLAPLPARIVTDAVVIAATFLVSRLLVFRAARPRTVQGSPC